MADGKKRRALAGGRRPSPPSNRRTVALEASPKPLDEILSLLADRARCDFRCYRATILNRCIQQRMKQNQIGNPASYLEFLHVKSDEVKGLAKELLGAQTGFFRDPNAFGFLRQQVVPEIVGGKQPGFPLRVWVPGCGTGEEAYSIAMLFLDHLTATGSNCHLQVFATDVNEDAIEVARLGMYSERIAADVGPQRLDRYFQRGDESVYRVKQELRDVVLFARHDLLRSPPYSRLDLISCRNLLACLKPGVCHKLFSLFHFALNRAGYLFLGRSDPARLATPLFEPVSRPWRVFLHTSAGPAELVELPIVATAQQPKASPNLAWAENARHGRLDQLIRGVLLREHTPAAVLINSQAQVLYYHGSTARYLELAPGEPTHDLLKLARQSLRAALRHAVAEAVSRRQRVTVPNALVERNGAFDYVRLTVQPVAMSGAAEELFLVTFAEGFGDRLREVVMDAGDNALVRRLEVELESTRSALRGTIGELEQSNERLQTSNEEILAMNAELQAANRHLETSQTKLYELNEELNTANTQLQDVAQDEQRRIGQDLHDGVGQELTGLGLLAETLLEALQKDSPGNVLLATKIAQGARRALAEVRHVCRGLLPVPLDSNGLQDALSELAARIREQSRADCTFVCTGQKPLQGTVEVNHLFRIAQEAASNALRHGQARTIRIGLRRDEQSVTLSIEDDGIGMGQPRQPADGVGLRIMHSRAQLLRGTLDVRPREGGGTRIICTVPRGAEAVDGEEIR
jgi:chemotaxis methyl-accepting protein methylase/signal transduction histidine kinase